MTSSTTGSGSGMRKLAMVRRMRMIHKMLGYLISFLRNSEIGLAEARPFDKLRDLSGTGR